MIIYEKQMRQLFPTKFGLVFHTVSSNNGQGDLLKYGWILWMDRCTHTEEEREKLYKNYMIANCI